MRDRIEINGLTVTTVVGTLPHEREIPQPLRVDLALEVDLHDAGRSDEPADTVDYGDVTDRIAAVMRENKDVLLERLADRIAEVAVGFRQGGGRRTDRRSCARRSASTSTPPQCAFIGRRPTTSCHQR